MGYMRHHGVAVVCYDRDKLIEVHARAKVLCEHLVSDIIESQINGYHSFFVAPDGSKEGWGESIAGDENRAKLRKFMDSYADEDGDNAIEYVEFRWGGDDDEAAIVADNTGGESEECD